MWNWERRVNCWIAAFRRCQKMALQKVEEESASCKKKKHSQTQRMSDDVACRGRRQRRSFHFTVYFFFSFILRIPSHRVALHFLYQARFNELINETNVFSKIMLNASHTHTHTAREECRLRLYYYAMSSIGRCKSTTIVRQTVKKHKGRGTKLLHWRWNEGVCTHTHTQTNTRMTWRAMVGRKEKRDGEERRILRTMLHLRKSVNGNIGICECWTMTITTTIWLSHAKTEMKWRWMQFILYAATVKKEQAK